MSIEERKGSRTTLDDVVSELNIIDTSIRGVETTVRKELHEIAKRTPLTPPSYTLVLWVIAGLLFLNLIRH